MSGSIVTPQAGRAVTIPAGLEVVLDHGLAVFPVRERTLDPEHKVKAPLTKHGVKDASADLKQIAEWARQYQNCAWAAAMTEAIGAIDTDVKRGVNGFESYAAIVAGHDALPDTLKSKTPSGGRHDLFRFERAFKNTTGFAPGLDMRSAGAYIIVPPSVIDAGRYEWLDPAAEIASAPEWLVEKLAELIGASKPALRAIPEGERNDTMYRYACALRARNVPKVEAWADLRQRNATDCDPPLTEAELRTIFANAWKFAPGFARSDTGNAQRFLAHHSADVHYVPAWREWILWAKESRWIREPEALGCIARVKATIVTALGTEVAGLPTPGDQQALARWLIQSQNTNRLESAVRNARSEPGVVLDAQLLDANRYLIGTQSGTLNLRDGSHRPARREDFITKRLGCAFDAKASAPKWHAFLATTTSGLVEIQQYLQQIVGLTLLGNLYRLVIFIYGQTSTGKSVFLEVIKALFGDYAKAAATDLLMLGALRTKHGPTEAVARLAGALMATVGETNSNDAFDEALIKDLTGRDTVSARAMYQSSFDFRPNFTIWIRGNHKPRFSGDDPAMLERLRLVPFTRQVPEHERNPALLDEIIAEELPGVLNWALAGALAVQAAGSVKTPLTVREATSEYAREMDTLGAFIEERCHADGQAAARELYDAFRRWSEAQGLRIIWTMQTFGRRMGERFTKKKVGDHWVYLRISMKPTAPVVGKPGFSVAVGDQEPM